MWPWVISGPGPARSDFGGLYPQVAPLIQPQQGADPFSTIGSAMGGLSGLSGSLSSAPASYQPPQPRQTWNPLLAPTSVGANTSWQSPVGGTPANFGSTFTGSYQPPQPTQTWNPQLGLGPAASVFQEVGVGNYPYAGFGNGFAPYSWWGQPMGSASWFGGGSSYSPSSFGAY